MYFVVLRCFFVVLLTLFVDAGSGAYAFTLDEQLDEPKMEARARRLFSIVECLACSGETVLESQSDIAAELRQYIRGAILRGESDEVILSDLKDRYGEQVVAVDGFSVDHSILVLFPLAVFAIGLVLLYRLVLRNRSAS